MSATMLSLFDYTGVMAEPWGAAGYNCYCVDIQHPAGVTYCSERNIHLVGADVRDFLPPRGPIALLAAFPPCTSVAVSGARWFKDKGLGALIEALTLFDCAVKVAEWSGAPYMIENPVSTVATYWREPDYRFHPYQYAGYEGGENDTYTKRTCLWTGGGFVMPEPRELDGVEPDDRIHKAPPSPERGNFRSATPRGFAQAVFEAHHVQETDR